MRIAIVEDDPILIESLQLLLSKQDGLTVVGAYRSAEKVLTSLKAVCPEILLTDLRLPRMSGIELIRKAKEIMPGLDIVAHMIFEDAESVFPAIKAGASGYLLKGSHPREIIDAMNKLRNGGATMSPALARKIIREFMYNGRDGGDLLSGHQYVVLRRIAEGLTCKEISDYSGSMSPDEVRTCIKNIYEKIRDNAAQAS